jgi:hypothetical protein
MKNWLNIKLCALWLSSGQIIQTGNTVYDRNLYISGHLSLLIVIVSPSVINAYNKSLFMYWGQIICIPNRTPIYDCSRAQFYYWQEVSDLNIKFKQTNVNWLSEWLATSLCWGTWLQILCLEPTKCHENFSDRIASIQMEFPHHGPHKYEAHVPTIHSPCSETQYIDIPCCSVLHLALFPNAFFKQKYSITLLTVVSEHLPLCIPLLPCINWWLGGISRCTQPYLQLVEW